MPEFCVFAFSPNFDDPWIGGGNTTSMKYIALYGEPETMYWAPATKEELREASQWFIIPPEMYS